MTVIVTKEIAKGLDLIKNGFYNINSLEKAINNQGMELHLDTKVVFEQLSKDEIITALFYGYEVKSDKVKLEDLPIAFEIVRNNGVIYNALFYGGAYYVADIENEISAKYSTDTVLKYINEGNWTVVENS